jgi:hypothetical protein
MTLYLSKNYRRINATSSVGRIAIPAKGEFGNPAIPAMKQFEILK